jgi:DNA-binding beta-propeller fold protein YncE
MVSPLRIAATLGGNLVVTDSRLQLLLRMNPNTLQADQALSLNGKPAGVGLSGNRIYVGDKTSGKADAFNADGGGFLFSFGVSEILEPSDIAVDAQAGLVFVSDVQAGRIWVFDLDGGLVSAIGSKGVLPNELYSPMGVAVDTVAGEVLVTDWGDFGNADITSPPSVKIYGYDGTHLATISGEGECNWFSGVCTGGFSRPMGIATQNGKIYFADLLLAQILVYDRIGLDQLTTVGDRPQLRLPADVAILNGTDLFALSNGTQTVEGFPGGAQ